MIKSDITADVSRHIAFLRDHTYHQYIFLHLKFSLNVALNSLELSDTYISKRTITGLDSGLSLGQQQVRICTDAGKLLIEPLVINLIEFGNGIHTFSIN